MAEERLEGGCVDGAVRVGDTVRRPAGPWTPAVHALLAHLAGTAGEFLDVVEARITAHAGGIRDNAAAGDEASGRLLRQGVPDALDQAIAELAGFPR